MKQFKCIGLALFIAPAIALAQATPDEVFALFNKRLDSVGKSLSNPPYTASETLVNGVYAFWSPKNDSVTLTNESASIFSLDRGVSWVYVAPGLPAVTDIDALRNAFLNNTKLDELLVHRYGKGQRKLIYFTAFDCPYCNNFEKQLKPLSRLGNATVYAVPSNLDHSDPVRSKVVRSLWCAPISWTDWSEFAQTRKFNPELLKTDTSQCSAVRSTDQAWLLHKMLRGGRTAVPFFLADDGWTGVPAAQASALEIKTIFTPPKSISEPLKFGQGRNIDVANWGADKAVQLPSAATSGGTYQIGEGLSGSDDTTAAKPADPDALKKLKAKLKKIF